MCEYCEKGKEKDFETDNHDFDMGIEGGTLSVFYQEPDNYHHICSADVKINYCPMCGRKLDD